LAEEELIGIRKRDGGFRLQPKSRPEDAEKYLGRASIKAEIQDRFVGLHRRNDSAHTMIHGGPSSGKTHTIEYIKHLVQKEHGFTEEDIISFDVSAGIKNEFSKFQGEIMDAIQQPNFEKTLRRFFKALFMEDSTAGKLEEDAEQREILKAIVNVVGDLNVARALQWYYNKIHDNFEEKAKCWRWLCGRDTTSKERDSMHVDRDTKKDTAMSLKVLSGYFDMYDFSHRGEKKLILFLDEMNNLAQVKDEIFIDCLRTLTRKKNLTLIFAATADRLKKLHNIFNNHVLLRFPGTSSIIHLVELDEGGQLHEVTNFVKELIEYRRDPTVDLKAEVEKYQSIAKDVDETLSEDYFPFTDEAVSAIAPYIQTLTDPKRELYPGSIMEALNSIVDLGYAADPGTKIFTKAKISKLAEL